MHVKYLGDEAHDRPDMGIDPTPLVPTPSKPLHHGEWLTSLIVDVVSSPITKGHPLQSYHAKRAEAIPSNLVTVGFPYHMGYVVLLSLYKDDC